MQLHKTDRARDALADNRSGDLSLHHRRILILTDGRRSINDLMAMLGHDILGDIDALMRAGYLVASDGALPAARAQAGGIGQRLRDTAARLRASAGEAMQPSATTTGDAGPATPSPPAAATVPATTTSTTSSTPTATASTPTPPTVARRSLAASKMYVMDLLQMQRDLGIAECRTEIQCAQGEAASVVALLDGVRHLIPLVSTGMAERILSRLDDVLPEPYLPALRALQSELTGKPVLAITNAA